MSETLLRVKKVFKEKFTEEPHLYYSPGRINLIGEHVDYNDGFVLPGAIDKGIYFAIALNGSNVVNCYSVDFDESVSVPIPEIKKSDNWKNYVLGVVNELVKAGMPAQGFNCVFGGNIPIGGGMSSSAALEGGISFALNELCNLGLDRKALALLGQRAEHDFPGVKCGIMDQYANMLGKKDMVVLLDCKNISHEHIPMDIEGYEIVMINSKVHHSLASSAYNQRRKECEAGLKIVGNLAGIRSFREINGAESLLPFKDKMTEDVYKRCLFVVEEIARTQKAADLLKKNETAAFGKLMFETHDGLKNLYEVSCIELDFLVDFAARDSNVVGSRLMGGGFGGSSINIIKSEGVSSFIADVLPAYKKQFGIDAEVYRVKVVDGAAAIVEN